MNKKTEAQTVGKPSDILISKSTLSNVHAIIKHATASSKKRPHEQTDNDNEKSIQRDRSKKIILDEDSYAESLGKIIQRDFFPDLPKLKANADYMEALDEGDVDRMKRIAAEYASTSAPYSNDTQVMHSTFTDTPDISAGNTGMETPSFPINPTFSTAANVCDISGTHSVDFDLSLDQFQSKYTGEDNASFSEIMQKNSEALNERIQKRFPKWPLLVGGTEQDKDSKKLEFPKSSQSNALLYYPQGQGSEVKAGFVCDKKIQHAATRLSSSIVESSLKSRISNIQGSMSVKDSSGTSKGYSFVAPTPSPIPERGGATPILTWGNIASTPVLLEPVDVGPLNLHTAGPEFKIPELPHREVLAKKMGDSAGRKMANKAQMYRKEGGVTPKQLDRKSSMSPALQNLIRRTTPRASSLKSPWDKSLQKKPNASSLVRKTTPSSSLTKRSGTPDRSFNSGS
jgi:protein DGCR14